MEKKKELLVRAYLVLILFVVYALVIVLKIGNITLIEGEKWRKKGGQNVKWIKVEADRGNIFDTNGKLLATSLPFFDIRIDLKVGSNQLFESELNGLCESLGKFPGKKTAVQWKKDLLAARAAGNQYYPLAKNLSYADLEKLKNYPVLKHGRAKAGRIIEKQTKRGKPYDELASRTIGLDRDNASKIGLEGAYDGFLTGETEQKLMKKLPPGYWIPVYESDNLTQKKGEDVVSTIDIVLQDIMHEELERACSQYKAMKGCAILMDVESGAIKGIANLDRLSNGSYHEIFNHAVATSSEPGSTMKLASTLALLENGVDLDSKVDLRGGKKQFYDLTMYDSDMHGIRIADLEHVFTRSSNVGIASMVADEFNSKKGRLEFRKKLEAFGLTNKTEIDIEGEPEPIIKHPVKDKKRWNGTTIPWMAHGYELMQTPLQVLNFYNAVANNGQLMQPYLVDRIQRNGELVKDMKPNNENAIISEITNIEKLKYILRKTVTDGTGKKANSEKVSIAGKTGTTRVNYYDKKNAKKYNASFVGYFPAEAPKYSMILVIYDPQGAYYGGTVAAPAFKKIAERVVSLELDILNKTIAEANLNLRRDEKGKGYSKDYEDVLAHMDVEINKTSRGKWVELTTKANELVLDKQKIKKSQVPDVTGMGLRDAIYVLEAVGLTVESTGFGKVQRQSVQAGSKNQGQLIEIYLN